MAALKSYQTFKEEIIPILHNPSFILKRFVPRKRISSMGMNKNDHRLVPRAWVRPSCALGPDSPLPGNLRRCPRAIVNGLQGKWWGLGRLDLQGSGCCPEVGGASESCELRGSII